MVPAVSAALRVSAVNAASTVGGARRVGVVAKRTYRAGDPGGACPVAPEQVPLVEVPPLLEPGHLGLAHDTDLLLGRALTDIVVQGHAYNHDSAPSFDASISV